MRTIEQRFREKVGSPTDNGCLEWRGWRNNRGYGMLREGPANRGHLLAHRVSFELNHGPVPEGMVVMHTCDNPACVNHFHLKLGTQADNVRDMIKKGRQPFGRFKRTKLTLEDRRQIKEMRNTGALQREIAKRFGVSRSMISMIVTDRPNIYWRQV